MSFCLEHGTHPTVVHVEEASNNWDSDRPTVVLAYCGASCKIEDDGLPHPCTFDFVRACDSNKADCEACLRQIEEQEEARELEEVS